MNLQQLLHQNDAERSSALICTEKEHISAASRPCPASRKRWLFLVRNRLYSLYFATFAAVTACVRSNPDHSTKINIVTLHIPQQPVSKGRIPVAGGE
jgi:hypothetical protein